MEENNYIQSKATYLPKEERTLSFPPDKTALLIIDPVNDFLSEGGAGWELTKNTVKTVNDVVPNLKRAIEGARSKGIKILFGPMAYTEEDYRDEHLQKKSGINRLMFEKKMFLAGSWGADFHPELKPAISDTVLLPHKSCDVFRTDLPEHLKKMGITHLVIAGMTANLCCESTARHAMEDGYDVTMLKDAIGAASIPEYETAVHINFPLISNAVIKVDEFLAAINSIPTEGLKIQEGDTVYGSDHLEIGNIEKIVEGNDKQESYLLVPSGLIFKTDLYIPMDAIVKRSGNSVFVNIPKIVVTEMPWKNPPLRSERAAKEGPILEEVGNLYRSQNPSIIG